MKTDSIVVPPKQLQLLKMRFELSIVLVSTVACAKCYISQGQTLRILSVSLSEAIKSEVLIAVNTL